MIHHIILKSEGMHGYVRACALLLDFSSAPSYDTIAGIVDAIAGQLQREIGNVRYVTSSISALNMAEFNANQGVELHATISICYEGQEAPSTEINFQFLKVQPYHFWKNKPDFQNLSRFLLDVEKELES